MCGIVGIVSKNRKNRVDRNLLETMRDTIQHRGPDGSDIWMNENEMVGLAHRRLSIIDLSPSAAQPMSNEDNQIWITFNGEIYNHEEIKAELVKTENHRWKTHHSDTEVILHAYEEWGINCINRFRGIFAIGLWDGREETLYVIRDRFGVKPMYYISNEDHFGFSSEMKPLFKIHKDKILNENGLIEYLTTRGSVAPNTMVKGINKLDKGHYIKVKIDSSKNSIDTTLTKYYDLNDHIPYTSFDFTNQETILRDLEDEIITSIKYRWISDSPVCLFLSGGIDSSLIAAISSKLFTEKVHAFTIGLPGNLNDETKYAKIVADQYNLNIHFLDFSSNPFDNLDEWLFYNDDLLSDPAAFAIFTLSKEIRDQGFKVVLSGEGSDEIFAGYNIYKKFYQSTQNNNPNWLLKNIFKQLYAITPNRRFEKYYTRFSDHQVYYGAAQLQSMLSLENLINNKSVLDNYCAWNYSFFEKRSHEDPINYALKYDLEYRIPNDLLLRTDRATMACGVEGRVPFLDHKLVEYAMSIPYSYKTGKNFSSPKKILKELALKYFTKEFVYRPKQGFPIPVTDWLLDKKVVSEFDKFINERIIGYLNYDYIASIYHRHKVKKEGYGDRLFNMYLLEKYVRFWDIRC
jgi:asparagine synthase (glutamine-hydrolysing)